MTPRCEAIAFRVWQHCQPREWNCNIKSVAAALGEPPRVVQAVVINKGWHRRFRLDAPSFENNNVKLVPGGYASLLETLAEHVGHIPPLN